MPHTTHIVRISPAHTKMGIGDNIVVNDFMFCRDHGSEYCHLCSCDHRLYNNIRIEDEIEDLAEDFDFNDRQPINAFELNARHRRGELYECLIHKKVDCGDCFNWVKTVRAEAEAAVKAERWLEKRQKWLDKVDP